MPSAPDWRSASAYTRFALPLMGGLEIRGPAIRSTRILLHAPIRRSACGAF